MKIVCIETNVDDMNPEWFDYCMECLFAVGAVDVFLERIQMKKNRPGFLLRVLTPSKKKEAAIAIILRETTSIGVRYFPVKRKIMTRKMKVIKTRIGKIPVKIATDKKLKIEKWIPEYEVCKKMAKRKKIPLREVYEEVLKCKPLSK